MNPSQLINGISAEAERIILQELEKLGVLITCETCGQCELPTDGTAPRCLTTVRGNGICAKSLVKAS